MRSNIDEYLKREKSTPKEGEFTPYLQNELKTAITIEH
jgi:hypothetical protein